MIDAPATGREQVAVGVLVGAAVLFAGFAIPRAASAGFYGALTLPLVLLAADLVIAAAVLTWWYPIRPVAQGLAAFGILVHALVMLRSGPVWTRGCSGVLLLAHSWALVRLFLMTGAEDDEADEFDEDEPGPQPAPFGAPTEMIETPVTEVVDLTVLEDEAVAEAPIHSEAAGATGDAPSDDGAAPDELVAPRDNADEPEHEHEERIR